VSDALPPGAWQHTCMAPGDEAACRGCQAQAAESGAPFFPSISEHGMDWRDGLDFLDRALDDCAQSGDDAPWAAIKVAAVREIVQAIRRWEDDVDDTISRATWEDAVVAGEPWADGEWRPDRSNPPGSTP
jgi:hypothetical protein